LLRQGKTDIIDSDPQANLSQSLEYLMNLKNLFTELSKEIAGEGSQLEKQLYERIQVLMLSLLQ
jgi:hypothetical protein